jgi:hypothetical protein
MATLLPGKTYCRLCGQTIAADDAVGGFPAFLKPTHRLGMFSDCIFHETCLAASADAAEAQALYEKWLAIWESRPLDLKTVAELDAWGKAAFAEFMAEAERVDSPKPPQRLDW